MAEKSPSYPRKSKYTWRWTCDVALCQFFWLQQEMVFGVTYKVTIKIWREGMIRIWREGMTDRSLLLILIPTFKIYVV
jgi:hypothetical protein